MRTHQSLLRYNGSMKPLLIAHRGDTEKFPENTMEAFQSAFDRGADGIEFDVHCHKGGDVVIVHDYTHDENLVYPSLEEVLSTFSSKGRMEIEIKAFEEECVLQAAEIVHRIKPQDYEVTSSEIPLIPVIRKLFPDALVGLLFKPCLIEEWMPVCHIHRMLLGYMKLLGTNILHLGLEHYSEELVELMHANGYRTHTHLGKENTEAYNKVVEFGIDQCTIDDFSVLG
jgi:glycerophosphoryl diester phosphodiesterase